MRHDSERVKGKNYRKFVDAPLFHHVLRALLDCSYSLRIVVDTDSPVVRDQIAEVFPAVDVLQRPEHLRAGTVQMTEVLRHDALQLDHPLFLQTHSTNPLLRPATISHAIDLFLENRDTCDSLFSVTRIQSRLYDADKRPINHDPEVLLRTQDLPPVYEENSNLYIYPRDLILESGRRIGSTPFLFEMDRLEAADIDNEVDFQLTEALFRSIRCVP